MSEAKGKDDERPGASRVYVVIKYSPDFVFFGFHYPVSRVRETGCPFGSK